MAEIKSTLDLVMEKTRHLKLSAEEKEEQTLNDYKNKLKGLLQHYQDEILDIDRFKEEYQKLARRFDVNDVKILQIEILDKLNLDDPNGHLTDLLKGLGDTDARSVVRVMRDCREAIQAAAKLRTGQMRDALKELRNISGDAVTPNLDADEKWRLEVRSIREKFEKRLNDEKTRLKSL